jgi:hypothetical protein
MQFCQSYAKVLKFCQVIPKLRNFPKFCQSCEILLKLSQTYEVLPSYEDKPISRILSRLHIKKKHQQQHLDRWVGK